MILTSVSEYRAIKDVGHHNTESNERRDQPSHPIVFWVTFIDDLLMFQPIRIKIILFRCMQRND